MSFVLVAWFFLLLGNHLVQPKRPDYIHKCATGNKQCILENISNIFYKKYSGDNALGLKELDPFDLNVIDISADPKNPVKVDLSFKNAKLYGGKYMKGSKVKGFSKSPTGHHDVLLEGPVLTIFADYKVNGKVLILPVKGEGKSNITMIQPQLKIGIEGVERTENDAIYMEVKTTTLDMICEKIEMNFSNLFNGDKALGDHFNEFINQNWREIFMDIKMPFLNEINKNIFVIVKRVFDTTPYTEFFEN